MSVLADYTNSSLLVPALDSADDCRAIAELSQLLQNERRISNSADLIKAVISRELLCSTAVAPGWALPHGRLSDVPQLCFALGRCRSPIKWFGSREPVRLVFLFVVPENAGAAYLSVVSGLARLGQDSARAGQLLRAPDSQSILEILQHTELSSSQRRQRSLPVAG